MILKGNIRGVYLANEADPLEEESQFYALTAMRWKRPLVPDCTYCVNVL
jgi:hypothetical protein